jgi:hypothetical protein
MLLKKKNTYCYPLVVKNERSGEPTQCRHNKEKNLHSLFAISLQSAGHIQYKSIRIDVLVI